MQFKLTRLDSDLDELRVKLHERVLACEVLANEIVVRYVIEGDAFSKSVHCKLPLTFLKLRLTYASK